MVINDGVRQEGQQWGDEHGIEIDELSVNRAEILKGPASLIYGSDAIAGVINFITSVPVADKTISPIPIVVVAMGIALVLLDCSLV